MLKVQILKITSPSSFWIADKDPLGFLKLIHNELSLQMEKNVNFNTLKADELIAVYDLNSKMWHRAQIVKEINSFSKSDMVICFYVDTGDKMSCRRIDCREICDPKLKSLPALAKHCCLYGIKPQSSNIFNRNEASEWKPAAIQFFHDLLKDESQCLLAAYTDPNESNQFETKLYAKENEQSLVCINNLMVVNRFASYWSLETKKNIEQLDQCVLNYNELNENHYNLTYMKIYLKTSRKAQMEKLLDEDQDARSDNELCAKPADANLVQNQRAILSNDFDVSKELLTNEPKLKPMKKIGNPLDQCVIDYLFLNGLTHVHDFTSYAWPVVFGGRHMFGLPTEKENDANFSLNYLAPLITLIIDKLELDYNANSQQSKETGYIKKSMNRAQNGPLLLIICPSCKQAQRIFEILTEIMNIFTRIDKNQHKTESTTGETFKPRRVFKPFLIQGGGNDSQYDIPLANGCDILISATPFCILRMIGEMKTNLERLKYIVFEEMHLLLTKYPKQIKALMDHYSNLLKINESQHIAQFCLFSSQWSHKLQSFIDSYLLEPIYIVNNRLESSYVGQTRHIVREYNSRVEKTHHLKQIVDSVCSSAKNTIIFTETNKSGDEIYQLLLNLNYANVHYVNAQTHSVNTKLIETKWKNCDCDLSQNASNFILILVQDSINNINIDNARCIIHYDFPLTKSAFADRLWFMRKHFFDVKKNENNEDLASSYKQSLCSFLLYGKSEREYSDSLVNFLKRVGQKEEQIPLGLVEMAAKRQEKRELKRTREPLCPFIKSFGKCMSPGYKSCPYRHLPNTETDKLALLDENFSVPSEGFVRFKVSHVEDANHCFINLLEHQDLAREKHVEYGTYLNFDMELQLYFSNRANIEYVDSFKKGDLYAIKDTSTSIFKRVCVEDCVEKRGSMVYTLVVKTVDYGAKFIVKSNDLIALPSQFKSLPGQAVEVYFCDIRPLEWDINWSRKAKVFVAEKLSKEKEFFGKIQMSAGKTLWLDPISSYKRLKAVDMIVVDDCIRLELIQNNYGAHYPSHLRDLRALFVKHNVSVPRVDDEMVKIKLEAMRFYETLYDFDPCELNELVSYAFLNVDDCFNEVFVSAVDTPSNFYLQSNNSYESLESLNKDIESYLKKFNQIKTQSEEEKSKKVELDFQAYSNRLQLIREKLSKQLVEYLTENKKAIYVLAKNSSANEFNRAKVLSFIPSGTDANVSEDQLLVFFVDYGDYEKVSVNEVYPISKTFLTQLPFQAINCSLNGIQPVSSNPVDVSSDVHSTSTSWSTESGDCLWETTHDKNNNHLMNYASIESCQTDQLENNKKKYSINLFARNVSLSVNAAERLVKMKHARLCEEKELKVFSFAQNSDNIQQNRDESSTPLRDFPKLVVERLIRNSNSKKQLENVAFLDSQLNFMKIMSHEDVIQTGSLQTLTKVLPFINDENVFMSIMKLIRKNFFLRKKSEYFKLFFENEGLSHLLIVLDQTENQELAEFILKTVQELLEWSLDLKELIVYDEDYMKFIWHLFERFQAHTAHLNKAVQIMQTLVNCVNESHTYSNRLLAYFEKCLKRMSANVEQIDVIKELHKQLFEKHKENELDISQKFGVEENNQADEEAKKKFFEMFIEANKKIDTYEKQNPNAFNHQHQQHQDKTTSSTNNTGKKHILPVPDSSDEEVEEMFENDLMNLLEAMKVINVPKPAQPEYNPFEGQENLNYKHPKIIWNQTNQTISLKVLLKNVKDMNIIYNKNSISFRVQLNEETWGFDLHLFAEIVCEESEGVTDKEHVLINLKKKYQGIWSRLLTSVKKSIYIKSEYDNLNEEDEEDAENKRRAEFNEYLKECQSNVTKKHLDNVYLDHSDDDGSTETDSDSDFDENQYNDVKESRDIYWD